MLWPWRAIVITPPDPVITPADVPGTHAADDATIAAYIAAATAEIDAPNGSLGRAIGEQVIELRMREFWPHGTLKLPFPPIIDIESVVYVDDDDIEQTIASSDYALAGRLLYPRSTFTYPDIGPDFEGVRIRYRAGYNGGSGSPAGTGDVPAPIKEWIKLRAAQMRSMAAVDPLVRSESEEGIDSVTYNVPSDIAAGFDSAYGVLLSQYRVYD